VKAVRLLFGLAAFAVPAGTYVACASVEPASWDTAELQGVPYILGITHPTGFPFYVLAGYAWSHLFAFGTIAWRMNVMSAAAMGVAGLAGYGVALEFGASVAVALAATLVFAFSPNIWSHAVRAEAQDLAMACAAVAVYAFVRWLHGAGDRWFRAAFALCGLGMAAHPNALWILPALVAGAAVAPRRPSLRLSATALVLVIAALALYLYLPLRSQYVVGHGLDPTIGMTGAGGGIFWNYNDPRTLHGLVRELTGSEFQTPGYFLASFNPVHVQDALWAFVEGLHLQFGTLSMLLIFGGFVAAWRRDWRAALVVTIASTAALLFSVIYPNESDVGRYRLLASWIAVPMLGALTPQARSSLAAALQSALVVFLVTSAAFSIARQHNFFYHPPNEGGRWVISAIRPYLPPGSAVVTGWLDATSLAYGAYVDGSLPGRIVLSDDRLDVPLYQRWARERRVFVLVDPHDVNDLAGTRDYATLDPYHELYEVMP
jgi:hypothetical protein